MLPQPFYAYLSAARNIPERVFGIGHENIHQRLLQEFDEQVKYPSCIKTGRMSASDPELGIFEPPLGDATLLNTDY